MRKRTPSPLVTLAMMAAWAAATLIASSCTEIGTDPTAAVAIEFDSLPFPSVVIGDTLRDTTGAPAPLRARAFNYKGELIPNAEITFVTRDTNATITSGGLLVAKPTTTAPIPVFAVAGSLQSLALNVPSVPRPDTLHPIGTVRELEYGPAVSQDSLKYSDSLTVVLESKGTGTTLTPVPSYLVSFRLEYDGRTFSQTDTAFLALVTADSAKFASHIDTTETTGRVSHRLRVRPSGLRSAVDSVIVFVTARYKQAAGVGGGAHVAGSPVRFVVHTRRRTS